LVSSIRLELAREGVEDYEYLKILQTAAEKLPPGHSDRQTAENVLARASQLVTMPNAGGRYSTKILPDPEAIERIRNDLAKVLEKLMAGQ
jgi:hypothetical protein